MKIASLKLKNFRGYKEEIEIKFDDLTVLVGKNDESAKLYNMCMRKI